VGNKDTMLPTRVVDAILAIEIYPAASKRVVVEFLAQYKPIPHVPEINKPKTTMNYSLSLKCATND
jgi:hypothetical protein